MADDTVKSEPTLPEDGINTSEDFGQKELQDRADAIEELGFIPLESDPRDHLEGVRAEAQSNQDETTPPEAEPSPNADGSENPPGPPEVQP